MNTVRIVRSDANNFAVEELREVEVTAKDETTGKRIKTGETRREWVEVGYYGHRLDWAAESALHRSVPIGIEITPSLVKEAVESVVNATKAGLK